jgi:glutamate racemase
VQHTLYPLPPVASVQNTDFEELALTSDLKQAIENTDIAVLACKCFPMVRTELESLFPGVIFLDPGAYCFGLLKESAVTQGRKLSIKVTGKVVSEAQVTDFARSYLDNGVNKCCI